MSVSSTLLSKQKNGRPFGRPFVHLIIKSLRLDSPVEHGGAGSVRLIIIVIPINVIKVYGRRVELATGVSIGTITTALTKERMKVWAEIPAPSVTTRRTILVGHQADDRGLCWAGRRA